ncbi:tyrosine-type recombinase/integrase [Alkalinema pantanalense CENA528]|uniref:tyrosine-type recombinase/integrase n=1 Tax=Alkalinema pantanalense TaxID=1620705 RepID=UPI003D6F4164
MGKRQLRGKKGSVSINERRGMLRLRWTYQGKQYQLSLGLPNSPLNQQSARAKAAEIERDIALQQFDPSLTKYRPLPNADLEPPPRPGTVELWQRWMDKRRDDGVSHQTLVNRYQTLSNLLTQFGRNIETPEDARDLMAYLSTRQSPATLNRNIKMLSTFADWCLNQGWLTVNPFSTLKPVKDTSPREPNRKPFTLPEIQVILTTFRTHPHYYAYHDFALVLFTLGLRPSEAIGLRWKHIDFTQRTVTIAESLSRSGKGSRRVRRGRKNGVTTVLTLPDEIYTMLQGRFNPAFNPDALVFTTTTGKAIDDHNFSQRIWRSILTQAGIPHRPPYACRHSMASHAIDQGATLPDVAYLMGHRNTAMVSKVYGHAVKRPNLPKLGL